MFKNLISFVEKYQDGDGAGQDVRHALLRHLVQTEAPGDEDAGGVQGGFGFPETSAHSGQPAAGGSGEEGDGSSESQTSQGGETDSPFGSVKIQPVVHEILC